MSYSEITPDGAESISIMYVVQVQISCAKLTMLGIELVIWRMHSPQTKLCDVPFRTSADAKV
jgi:hypothetical protein